MLGASAVSSEEFDGFACEIGAPVPPHAVRSTVKIGIIIFFINNYNYVLAWVLFQKSDLTATKGFRQTLALMRNIGAALALGFI